MTQRTCAWPGCERSDILARGLCGRDYRRARRTGVLAEFAVTVRTCDVCGSNFAAGKHGKRYCSEACRRSGWTSSLAERRAGRVEAKAGRCCVGCGAAIPSRARADARFCSTTCQQASWYSADADRLRAASRTWAGANPERRNEAEQRRRARQNGVEAERIDRAELWETSGGRCVLCGHQIDPTLRHPDPLSGSLDHIVPLSRGGSHTRSNVQLTHLRCNLRKGVKIAPAEAVV